MASHLLRYGRTFGRVFALESSVLARPRFSSGIPATTSARSEQEPAAEPAVKPFSAIPGPKPLPVLRNLLELKKNLPRMHLYLEDCHDIYGEIFKLEAPGNNNFVVMADPNHLENVLRAEGKYPVRDVNFTPRLAWIMTNLGYPPSFASRDGKEWKEGRSAVNNQIKPRNVASYTPGLNGVVSRFIHYLKSAKDERDRINDVAIPLKRLLVDLSAKFVYNDDLHVFDNPTDESEEFIKAVELFFNCIGRIVIEPPLYKLYPNKLYQDFDKSIKVLYGFGLKYAEQVRERLESAQHGEEESEVQGLLEQWLREGKMNEREALALSTGMFFAGVDTTANQAAFLLYCMAKNPDVQEELYEQIVSVLGDRTQPTLEDLPKIPYLKGCMLESFRLMPTVTTVPRVLQEDIMLMGYHVPAMTNIWYINSIAAKNEQLFPNAKKFDPGRWARDKPDPFAILLFGFGPRSCYGKRFAELELKLLLCQITQNFVLGTELEQLDIINNGVVEPAGDLPLFLKERKK